MADAQKTADWDPRCPSCGAEIALVEPIIGSPWWYCPSCKFDSREMHRG